MSRPFRVEPVWPGKTVVIIGGGPSLTLKQVHRIAETRLSQACRVMVVNDAVFVAWWADWLHGCDANWWHKHAQTATRYGGIKTTLSEGLPLAWGVGLLKNTGQDGFDPDPGNVRTGGNGVYQSMHSAIHAGAAKIVLVGVDFHVNTGGPTHWHAGHGREWCKPAYLKAMAPRFETLKPILAERKIDVVNCSPGTALEAFRKGDLEAEIAPRLH